MALRIVFAGTPDAAVPALRACAASDHTVVQVFTQPPRRSGRGRAIAPSAVQAAAEELSLPVSAPTDLRDPQELAALRDLAPDLGVVVAYGHILRRGWLEAPPLGWINLHFSLLPRWRGAAPVAAAIRAGDAETGVSVIRLVPALDAGPVLAVARTAIGGQETAGELTARLAALGAPVLMDVVDRLAAGSIDGEPQDDAQATVAPTLTKRDGKIDWEAPAEAIARQVRAMTPWPGAHAVYLGLSAQSTLPVTLLATEPSGTEVDAAPGAVVRSGKEAALVATGAGGLRVLRLKPSGKRAMGWGDFKNGYRAAAGDLFS